MRTLFIIVGLLGLFLAGLGGLEYRAACGGESMVCDMTLKYMHDEELKAKKEGAPGIMFNIVWPDFNLPQLKKGSVAVVCFGAAFFLIGTTGIFTSRPTAKKPAAGDSYIQ